MSSSDISTGSSTAGSTRSGRRVRQPVQVVHLVAGLVFLGVAAVWALDASGAIEDVDLGLVMPAVLVVAGAVGLVASLARGRGREPAPLSGVADASDRED